jgi:pyruvate dehydrogenase E2 component (dihydrolipoamide acetyltransferase)
MKTFNLPDLAEGLAEAEIIEWYVSVGDKVRQDQLLVSVETAKAVVEVPSPYTGKITKLYAQKGDSVETGKALIEFDLENAQVDTGTVVGNLEVGTHVLHHMDEVVLEKSTINIHKAMPAVRALARKLGVDLTDVIPTGVEGTVSAQDVERAHLRADASSTVLLRGVRRQMALSMAKSHTEVVPVTIFDDADISAWTGNKDYTARLIQAIVYASQKEPALNAWYDSAKMGVRLWQEVHVGMAVDTVDGLFVPVIKDAQEKSVVQLREIIDNLKQKVIARTITPQELQGQTITVSNFGKYAGRYANAIIMPPMVAILAVGRFRNNSLPLSLSFDHRAATGGEATRFLGFIIEALERAD